MPRNLISAFARGNQELFHSAFLAWLLGKSSPHALGGAVLEGLLSLVGLYLPNQSYTIQTEACDRGCRFDILIQSAESGPLKKGLVIENKTKSLGQHLQLDRYRDQGYQVAALALLPQTLDASTRARYPVIEYRQIRDLVSSARLHRTPRSPAAARKTVMPASGELAGVSAAKLVPSVIPSYGR